MSLPDQMLRSFGVAGGPRGGARVTRPRLTDRVLRGLDKALFCPPLVNVLNYAEDLKNIEGYANAADLADARAARRWVEAMIEWRKEKGRS